MSSMSFSGGSQGITRESKRASRSIGMSTPSKFGIDFDAEYVGGPLDLFTPGRNLSLGAGCGRSAF